MLSISEVNAFAQSRPIDLALRAGTDSHTLVLHGGYEGQGDFFSIALRDIEYIELAGGFPLGGLLQDDFSVISRRCERWASLLGTYTGTSLALWTADAATFEDSLPQNKFLVVANSILCSAGVQWSAPGS